MLDCDFEILEYKVLAQCEWSIQYSLTRTILAYGLLVCNVVLHTRIQAVFTLAVFLQSQCFFFLLQSTHFTQSWQFFRRCILGSQQRKHSPFFFQKYVRSVIGLVPKERHLFKQRIHGRGKCLCQSSCFSIWWGDISVYLTDSCPGLAAGQFLG